jgi:hypothetical protein
VTARHRQLDIYSHRLNRAADVVPEVLDHLDEQRAIIGPLDQGSEIRGGSGTHGDPVLRTVMALDGGEYHRRCIYDALQTLGVCIDMLDDACRKAIGYRAGQRSPNEQAQDNAKPRCIGDGTPTGATCWNIPSARRTPDGASVDDGRCHECGPRHDRVRRAASDARRLRRHQEQLGA